MAHFDELHAALTASDWRSALDHALAAWRNTRAPALADLIDRITARCTLPQPPTALPEERQAWWVEHGRVAYGPDAVTTAGLLAMLEQRADHLDAAIGKVRARWTTGAQTVLATHLGRSNAWSTNFQERVAILLDWPDDPRVAMALVDAARSATVPHSHGIATMYEILADRVVEIGDVRVIDKLAVMTAEPRGGNDTLRRLQVTFGTRAVAGFTTKTTPRLAGPKLADCNALLPAEPNPPPPVPRLKIEVMWREVAANPDDVGTRAVLGDALAEAADLRGDVIVLQCNARVPTRPLRSANRTAYDGRIKTLLRLQWHHWLGDLALVLPRRACEFRGGMLELATVGLSTSPDWAFAKARGHRELACVHTVRPGWVTPENFATFVLGLPRFPRTLGATGVDVIDTLATRGADFERLQTLELVRSAVTGPNDRPLPDWTSKPLRETLARIAVKLPRVRELIVRNSMIARQFVGFRREVQMMFPMLQRLAVDEPTALDAPSLVNDGTFVVAK